MKPLAIALLALAATTSGCAANAPEATTGSSEEALATFTPLDRVTPAEIAAVYARDVVQHLAACVAAHPDIVTLDRSNLGRFIQVGGVSYFDVRTTVQGLLAADGAATITPAAVAARVEDHALRALSAHVDAAGFYPSSGGLLEYSRAETRARELAAHGAAAAPGGRSLEELRAVWRDVERARGALDSDWLRPLRASGTPSVAEVRRVMRVPADAFFEISGEAAVDEFHEASEGPDRAPEFAPLASFLKSGAVKERWLFQAADTSGSTNILVVLDEHDQLWGMQMGYSE